MTTPEASSKYKFIRKPLLHKVIFSLESHPDDTSMCVTADDVNFVTNPEYVYCT